ncbi:MAG: Transcription factor WhiB [Microbacterium sp.]|jgi:hypothetical protein|nr:Transcription factor WhiB [Microbacterium sp.]
MSDWRDKAACRGMNPTRGNDPFYDQDGIENPIWDAAARICEPCKVTTECLAAALRAEEGRATRHGFVGGLSPEQRKRVHLGLPAVPAKKPRKERETPIDQAALHAARVEANNRRKGRETPCPADTPAPTQTTAP